MSWPQFFLLMSAAYLGPRVSPRFGVLVGFALVVAAAVSVLKEFP